MNSEAGSAPVSVVIPCYRCSTTISRAVESILRQTLKPAEIILVDDASEDGTLAVLQELADFHHGWIKVLQFDMNCGAASARNAGWEDASQPYIAFLDADDAWHPEKLSIQYECMRNEPDIALCGHQCFWFRKGESLPEISKSMLVTRISAQSLLFKNSIFTSSAMLKRDLSFRFEEGKRYTEDLRLWQQIAFAGLKVARIEGVLGYSHKPFYGAGGLSAQLWKMEKGELDNLRLLRREQNIGWMLFWAATIFSTVKFIKRLIVSQFRRVAD